MITIEDLKIIKFVPQPTQAEKNQERKAVKDQVARLLMITTLL